MTKAKKPDDRVLEGLPFSAADIPPAFKDIALDIKVNASGSIQWGWKQWIAITPRIAKHLKTHGRVKLANAVIAAQKAELPKDQHRSEKALGVTVSPSNRGFDVVKLVGFIAAMQQAQPPVKAKPAAAVQPPPAPALPLEEFVQRGLAAQATVNGLVEASQPSPAPSVPQDLQAFLATPIGAFVPGFRAFLKDTLHDMLIPHRDFIAETVRNAVIDVVGAPAIAAAPTPAAPAQKAEPDPDPEPEQRQQQQPPQVVVECKDAPHDLESQVALAAKALGITAPPPKHSVLVVGLHPKVEQEVEKFYGKAFRFLFRRPDAFNSSNDVPPSVDIILVHRKTLTKELIQMTRRDNLPVQHIQNNSAAVLGALREFAPESSHGLFVQ